MLTCASLGLNRGTAMSKKRYYRKCTCQAPLRDDGSCPYGCAADKMAFKVKRVTTDKKEAGK